MDRTSARSSVSASVLWIIKEPIQDTVAENAFDPARIVVLLVGTCPSKIASL
jgi:hypothetical protein